MPACKAFLSVLISICNVSLYIMACDELQHTTADWRDLNAHHCKLQVHMMAGHLSAAYAKNMPRKWLASPVVKLAWRISLLTHLIVIV